MKKNMWAGMAILSLLLSACGGTPVEPTISAEAVQATAVAAAFTVVAETQAAIPTNTPVPPTNTPLPTALPTDTPAPSPTSVELVNTSPTIVPTFTSQPTTSSSGADPCNKPLTAWQGPSANFNIVYEYSPQAKDDKVVVSMWVMTDLGECGYLASLSTGPVGQYSVAAFVDGKKDFKVFGGFRITDAAWDIAIRNDAIIALASCYPSC